MRIEGEAGLNLFTTPPVFIIVCNNTMVSREVYKYIAGYQTVNEAGESINVQGHFPVFSNFDSQNLPKEKAPTLLIDSTAIEDAEDVIDDNFKRIFATEIDTFKKEYAILHGAGSADQISEAEILREVVNTVGKQNTLGGHIRCVVSVSMLTEGWDANTVTHVMGIRAFGSQLLCEQVVGRALRRRNYDLVPYDLDGNELDSKTVSRRSKKNVVYKFPPEYAHVIGVPFKTFKSGKGGVTPPQKPKTTIRAVKEREEYEIRFPNIIGYRSENPDGIISADFENVPKFRIDFTQIPTRTTLMNPIEGKTEILATDCHDYRDAQVIYYLTWLLLRNRYNSKEGGQQFQKFGQLKKVVETWYNKQLQVVGGDDKPEHLRRLVLLWNGDEVIASIYEGIKQANVDKERITAILNYYNPEGSTSHVFGSTTKPVYPTIKSHVNYVVADTNSWEQIAAKTLDEMPQVVCYVKNHFLGFEIPYMLGIEEKIYIPDFIAKVKTADGRDVFLVIEISGASGDVTGHKDAKRHFTLDYWIPAANNIGKYGVWDYIEISDIDNINQILQEKINSL